jgi:hypothetical protein
MTLLSVATTGLLSLCVLWMMRRRFWSAIYFCADVSSTLALEGCIVLTSAVPVLSKVVLWMHTHML